VPGARSVISVLHTYYQEEATPPDDPALGRISRYAVGEDYHLVLKDRLHELFECLREEAGSVEGRAFTDSAPVMDKVWAQRSGLGWIGKHTNLLRRESGSWFFIGELIVDLELPPDDPATDYCGSCTRCLDACPTGAIYRPYAVDANRCISYTTIEHRGDDVPPDIAARHDNWIFGCDICQEVCPWNKFRKETREPRYAVRPGTTSTPLDTWEELDLEAFRERFKNSPVKRTKLEGFKRNVRIAQANRERRTTYAQDDPRPPPLPPAADGQ
jgi:epoxyqueuosine reductase